MSGRRAYGGALRRHESAEIDPAAAIGLDASHPAVVEGRSLFPSTVAPSYLSPRFLVSGQNNPKLGKEVLKGPRTGWPIYHLTLEERATCPRTCEQWRACYGNAMHLARRHAVDDDFLFLLKAEVLTMARQHDEGFLVRLHTLGDFYSVAYVETWAKLLTACPSLHVFGYTARRDDDEDPESAAIANALIRVTIQHGWERWAIRTSTSAPGPRSRAIVVDEPVEDPATIMCPEQMGATTACATCGLCWATGARDKAIGFLRHGMKRPRGKAVADLIPVGKPHFDRRTGRLRRLVAARQEQFREVVADVAREIASGLVDDGGVTAAAYAATNGLEVRGGMVEAAQAVRVARARALSPLPDNERALLTAFREHADKDGNCRAARAVLLDAARLPEGSWSRTLGALRRRGYVAVLDHPSKRRPGLFSVLMADRS